MPSTCGQIPMRLTVRNGLFCRGWTVTRRKSDSFNSFVFSPVYLDSVDTFNVNSAHSSLRTKVISLSLSHLSPIFHIAIIVGHQYSRPHGMFADFREVTRILVLQRCHSLCIVLGRRPERLFSLIANDNSQSHN